MRSELLKPRPRPHLVSLGADRPPISLGTHRPPPHCNGSSAQPPPARTDI